MDILRILVHLVSSSFGLIYIITLSKWKYSKKITFLATSSYIAVTTTTNYLIIKNLADLIARYPVHDFVYRIGNMFFVFVAAHFLTKQKESQRIFVALAAGVAVFSVDTVAITIRILFKAYPFELLFEFLMYPLMFLLILRWRKEFVSVSEYLQNRLLPLCGVFIVLLTCLFLQISVPVPLERAPENIPTALMICGISIGVYGILIFLFKSVGKQNNLEKNVMAMRMYVSSLERQSEIVNQNAKKAAIMNHDLRHVTQMISICLANSDIDGAMELVSRLEANARQQLDIKVKDFTGHKLMDATISNFVDVAKEAGIDIKVKMDSMESIKADKAELAVVLANALENAIHACQEIAACGGRIIRVKGYQQGNQFFLEIANTCAGNVEFDSVSGLPMRDGGNSGIGCKSMAIFAEKYDAQMEYRFEDKWLHLLMLVK